MQLTRDQYKAFKGLLLGLPPWGDEEKRKVFIKDALWGHALLSQILWKEDAATAATSMLEACAGSDLPTQDGKPPLCALLAEIREQGWANGERAGILATLEQALGCSAKKATWSSAPYPGLLALDRWQAPIFFGRTRETRELIDRLATPQGERLLLITGASGSGKSSLVRAGVWAWLEEGRAPKLPGSKEWLITAMFPSAQRDAAQQADPFLALTNSLSADRRFGQLRPGDEAERLKADPNAFDGLLQRVLDRLPQGAEWLLILDQMEELFTPACAPQREPFLDLLLAAVERPRFRVIATLRSDFLHQCIDHPGLLQVLNHQGHYGVRQPGHNDLARMIAGPVEELALAAPVSIEGELVDQMVEEAVREPGGLALLAFALADLYPRCQARGHMDLKAWRHAEFGGLKGVIQRRADDALQRAGEAGRQALPRVFSHLVAVQPDGTATRRREAMRRWADDPAALRLIEEFTSPQTRLLVAGPDDGGGPGGILEVAHEALLREWPTLTQWIGDCGEALRLRDKVREEAAAWVRAGRPESRRWRHELLAPARELLIEADLLGALEQDANIADFLTPEADRLLAELLDSDTDHPRREAIGMRLCEIGDPRPGVGLIDGVPDILWREIPGGEVEIEKHGRFQVEPFHIATYPVTYAQYQAFLEAQDGYGSKAWWKGLEKEDESGKQLRPYASYPADNLSWYDATAFCRWLSARLGYEVRLPDEGEWQWAAQGARSGFAYPWGPEWRQGLANTSESGIGRTTAVGMYPGGQSAQGLYDLAGNVWEWCRNEDDDPRNSRVGGEGSRVLRGGSWLDLQDLARADYRNVNHPYVRYDLFGFRLVCSSPIR
jgi:hypothetical protein